MVADTVVADTVVAAISDAAGKAVPAGVAGLALPKPYVPGSGARVPAEFRLVLAGYVGIAGGLFATALAHAAVAVFLFFVVFFVSFIDEDVDPDGVLVWFLLASACIFGGARRSRRRSRVFEAAPAAQRSTHGHGDGLEAWWTHTGT